MHILHMQRFVMTIATAALIGVIAGLGIQGATTASADIAARSAARTCSIGCISRTWLWLPAMRRVR